MRRLSHAEDRADDRRRERPQPHLPVHPAVGDGAPQGAELVYVVPYGQESGMGDRGAEEVAGVLAVAGRAVITATSHKPQATSRKRPPRVTAFSGGCGTSRRS